jgi:hypothetical protein
LKDEKTSKRVSKPSLLIIKMKFVQQLILLAAAFAMGGCLAQDACAITEPDPKTQESEMAAACPTGTKICTIDASTFDSTKALEESCK